MQMVRIFDHFWMEIAVTTKLVFIYPGRMKPIAGSLPACLEMR